MSYLILRLESTDEPIGIAEIPNDPDEARMIAQFNVYHREADSISANWISQAEFETYKALELFPEFGCCYRSEAVHCSIGIYDPVAFYLENNQVRSKSNFSRHASQFSHIRLSHEWA